MPGFADHLTRTIASLALLAVSFVGGPVVAESGTALAVELTIEAVEVGPSEFVAVVKAAEGGLVAHQALRVAGETAGALRGRAIAPRGFSAVPRFEPRCAERLRFTRTIELLL